MRPETALRAAAAGASTGGRTFTALAALVAATPAEADTRPDSTLDRTWVRATTVLLALGELTADKLPQAPSRLSPPGLGGRVLTAAGVGALVAHRAERSAGRRDLVLGATLSVAAAVVTAWLGVRGRALGASRLGDDRPGAVLEDAVVLGLAATVARSLAPQAVSAGGGAA